MELNKETILKFSVLVEHKNQNFIKITFINGLDGYVTENYDCIDLVEAWLHIDTIEEFESLMNTKVSKTLSNIKKENKDFDLNYFKNLYCV